MCKYKIQVLVKNIILFLLVSLHLSIETSAGTGTTCCGKRDFFTMQDFRFVTPSTYMRIFIRGSQNKATNLYNIK